MESENNASALLTDIVQQSQEIGSETRWMAYYCYAQNNTDQIGAIENTVSCIETALTIIKEKLNKLKEM